MAPNSDSLKADVKKSIANSGLFLSRHPSIDGWKQTRSVGPEVVSFTNKSVTPIFDRLSIKFYQEGETDEDAYFYTDDTWEIEIHDRGDMDSCYAMNPDEYTFHTLDDAIEKLVEVMVEVSEKRSL